MAFLLEGHVEDPEIAGLRRKVQHLEATVEDLRETLEIEQKRSRSALMAQQALRDQLGGLYGAMQQLFGHLEAAGVPNAPTGSVAPYSKAWDSWKSKMGGRTADLIQVLLDHGELSRDQIRIAMQAGWSTVDTAIKKLKDAQLLEGGNGSKYRLKQL